ncbi:MAG: ankyrin repeat domain-containing protein [Rickettsia sp.]|uniref:ankyrin repeat domain-containing protein n=1 Tax=Rickettsia sp. TaxID=789 RepID=UPI003978F508
MFMHFQHIIAILRKFDPNFNESEINSAITFSLKCSNNNIPREIAEIITSIYPDSNSVIAALWFFIIENNNLKSIKIEHFFSKEIFDIFYALTKLFKIHNIYSDVTSQKTIRLLSSLDSNIKIKVLLIRFAYLLHKITFNSNISHIEYVWISKEISKIYVPLFKEIKVEKIKVALQNACFKNLHPRLYKTIISFLDREYLHYELVAQIIDAFHKVLPATNIEYTISGRIKSPYSIAKKIVHKSSTIQQLYDIIGIRIIVEKEQECYDILGAIYKRYVYIPERYKNLIKFPRKNGYQSLHTVIINKDLRKVEVQIRTKIMHYIAEYGTASHSQYKMGLINISNIAYNILNRLILDILNQLTIIPILHGRINNGDKVYAQLLTNEVSRDVLAQQLLNINLENKTFVNDKVPDIIDEWNDNLPLHDAVKSGYKDIVELLLPQSTDVNILDQHHKTPLHYVAASRQSRASTPVNIRTNEISSNPLESLDLDVEQESNNANDSGIVESDVQDYTTFKPPRASTPVNIRTNEISTCINSTVDGTLINLANLPNLVSTSLDLSNKLLDDKDMEYLFKILLPETCITSLNLSNNILVCGKVNGIRYLTHLLNTRIASLNLSNNRLGQLPQEDIEHFISILPNTQITSLNLSNNQLTCQHLKYFAHTLAKTNIMLLDLSNNSLGGEEDMEDFINILSKTKITSLNLSDNNLDDADIYNLADILPNSRITNINLSYNDVTPDLHNEILIDALQQSPLITRFDIDDELLFSKANTIINQNQENNKNLFSIFNKIVCKDNNNLTLIKKDTIEIDEYFFVIKHLIKTTNVLYLLSTQYQINNTKMWFTEEELINFIQRIPSEFRELMTLLDCQVTTQVNVLQECEKNDMSEVVKELLLARELYKTNKEKNILHEYVYILLSKYELPIIHDGMCNNPSREDLIHHFQSNDYQENQEAQYVVSLLGNDL